MKIGTAFIAILALTGEYSLAEPFMADLIPTAIESDFEAPDYTFTILVKNVGTVATFGQRDKLHVKVNDKEFAGELWQAQGQTVFTLTKEPIAPEGLGMIYVYAEGETAPFTECTDVKVEIDTQKEVQFGTSGMNPYANDAQTIKAKKAVSQPACPTN